MLKADAPYEQEGRHQEAERAEHAETLRMRAIVAAVEAAQSRGEAVSLAQELRNGGRNVGRTVAETLAYVSAVQDLEDQRRLARARRAFARFLEGHGGDAEGFSTVAADVSAPTVREVGLAQLREEQSRAEQLQRGREIGEQRRFAAQHDMIRTIAQEEILLDKFGQQQQQGGRRGR